MQTLHILLLCGAVGLAACGSDAPPGPPLLPLPDERPCMASSDTPNLLSETGCFESLLPLEPGASLVPYSLSSPLWTDGTHKERYLSIPAGTSVGLTEAGPWVLPEGSVLVKNFILERIVGDQQTREPVETRIMVLRDGDWDFHSYEWNVERTDATLRDPDESDVVSYVVEADGAQRHIQYVFPDRTACAACHSEAAGLVLGPRSDQLNLTHDYGHVRANQLEAMDEVGMFGPVGSLPPMPLTEMPDPSDERLPIEERARSWLHGNCGHCHQPGGWSSAELEMDLRYETGLAASLTCGHERRFFGADLGRYLISPGDPGDSAIYIRMTRDDILRMPPVGVSVVDPLGERLLREWIESLEGCPDET